MNIGEEVVVIKSHYVGVKNGTKSKILRIVKDHRGKGNHLFVLSTKNALFWEHEIKKVEYE